MSLKKDLQNRWHDFIHMLKGSATDFVKSLADSIETNGGAVLRNAAFAAVTAAETKGGSGEDKFKAAYEAVVATLLAQDVTVVVNAVRGAIEAAVAELNDVPATPAA